MSFLFYFHSLILKTSSQFDALAFWKYKNSGKKRWGNDFISGRLFFEEMNWEEKSSTIYHCTVFGWVIKSVLAFVLLRIWFKYFRLCTHNNCPNVLIFMGNKKNYALSFFYESKNRFGLRIKLFDLVQIFLTTTIKDISLLIFCLWIMSKRFLSGPKSFGPTQNSYVYRRMGLK